MKTSSLAVVIDPVPSVFKFHTLCTQFMLILIDVQYSQKAVFSFVKGLNSQNHSSSGTNHPVKKSPKQNFRFPTPILPSHFPGGENMNLLLNL